MNDRYKVKNELVVVHIDTQPEDVQFWRVAVPNDEETKRQILNEFHTVPYIARLGVQPTLNKLR